MLTLSLYKWDAAQILSWDVCDAIEVGWQVSAQHRDYITTRHITGHMQVMWLGYGRGFRRAGKPQQAGVDLVLFVGMHVLVHSLTTYRKHFKRTAASQRPWERARILKNHYYIHIYAHCHHATNDMYVQFLMCTHILRKHLEISWN